MLIYVQVDIYPSSFLLLKWKFCPQKCLCGNFLSLKWRKCSSFCFFIYFKALTYVSYTITYFPTTETKTSSSLYFLFLLTNLLPEENNPFISKSLVLSILNAYFLPNVGLFTLSQHLCFFTKCAWLFFNALALFQCSCNSWGEESFL